MWPHQTVVQQFTYGYDIMGATSPTGVFRPHLKPAMLSEDDLLSSASQWHDEIWRSPCPVNADDIYEQTMQEVDRRLAGPLQPRSYWDRTFGPNGWRGCIRFAIWQGSKLRCIDDGKRSLHNLGQEIYEKIHHCSAEFGGTIAVYAARQVAGPWPEWMQIHMGTDDLNEAYRGCPTSECSARWSIVLVFDVVANSWAGSMMYGHSYGFRSSVNNFNAWPELQVAFSRRALRVPTSHYVDDFPIADFISGGNTAQDSLHALFDATGTGWAAKKAQPLAPVTKFLGQVSDFGDMMTEHVVRYRATEGRADTIHSYCREALATQSLTPGKASKLRGLVQFYSSTTQGCIGKVGHAPLVARSTGQDPGPALNETLARALT